MPDSKKPPAANHSLIRPLDEFEAAMAELRRTLTGYETAARAIRRDLAHGATVRDALERKGIGTWRQALSEELNHLEAARYRMREAMFVAMHREGTTIADIASVWNLSRQLVSRMLRDVQGPSRPGRPRKKGTPDVDPGS